MFIHLFIISKYELKCIFWPLSKIKDQGKHYGQLGFTLFHMIYFPLWNSTVKTYQTLTYKNPNFLSCRWELPSMNYVSFLMTFFYVLFFKMLTIFINSCWKLWFLRIQRSMNLFQWLICFNMFLLNKNICTYLPMYAHVFS